tara:strand:- start:462 stop:719 length:258 start_codon:yes stop_codon:yes gene_type:complete
MNSVFTFLTASRYKTCQVRQNVASVHNIGTLGTIDAGDTLSGHLPAIPAPATLFLAVLFSSLFVQFALPMTCLLANCNKQCSCGL